MITHARNQLKRSTPPHTKKTVVLQIIQKGLFSHSNGPGWHIEIDHTSQYVQQIKTGEKLKCSWPSRPAVATTVVPHKTMLIRSAKIAVLQKHRLAKRCSPLECTEIYLMHSNSEKIIVLQKLSIENIILRNAVPHWNALKSI